MQNQAAIVLEPLAAELLSQVVVLVKIASTDLAV